LRSCSSLISLATLEIVNGIVAMCLLID